MNKFKSGFVTVIGVPNSGKSSLVNALVKESVSIVTPKPQTTRKRTLGILTKPDECQIVFIDTPGVIEAGSKKSLSEAGLNQFLNNELQEALQDVDVVVGTIAPWELESDEIPWVLRIKDSVKAPLILTATQADRKLNLSKWQKWMASGEELLLTSSQSGLNLDKLMDKIQLELSEGPQYYDAEIFTPQTMRDLSAEMVRKYCFQLLHQEIPYGLGVIIREFEEKNIYKINADIVISKESHKGMVIGQGGQLLKKIGTLARQEMEKTFDKKVFLQLHVVVKPHWIKDKKWLEEFGYELGS